jgi:glycosyltransferase involved in cell wall biosynthesis
MVGSIPKQIINYTLSITVMRILMLNYEYPPLGGGAGIATKNLLQEFSDRKDIEIDLITSSTEGYKEKQLSSNIKIYFLDIGKKGSKLNQSVKDLLTYSWKSYWFSKNLIKKNRYNLTHSFFSVPCGYIAMKLGIPYTVCLRGSDVPGHNPDRFKTIYKILGPAIKKVFKKAALVTANSSDLRKSALRFENSVDIVTIPNGINCQKFKPFSKDKKRKDKKLRILFVGKFHKIKGIEYLLKAFKSFAKDKKDVELSLVGDGLLFDELKNKYESDNVTFWGRLNNDVVRSVFKEHDIYVLPSLNEGMSNTILEAIASGLAVLATNTGGAKELLNNKNGFIIRRKSFKSIQDKLELLYVKPELLEKMKNRSRRKALNMSWTQVADKFATVYEVLDGMPEYSAIPGMVQEQIA